MPTRIEITEGDITQLRVDAIVNAANPSLLGGGGVDGAIHRVAGPGLLEECRALHEIMPGVRCPAGQAKITQGHQLAARHIIHTVGPIWQGGDSSEEQTLAICYRNVFRLAAAYNCESVAIPAISTGAHGFPLERAARIALQESHAFARRQSYVERIIHVCFDADARQIFELALRSAVDH